MRHDGNERLPWEQSWRTNRRTKKRFPTDRTYDPDNAMDRIAMNEETLAPMQDGDDFRDEFQCEGCQLTFSGSRYTLNGHTICRECKLLVESGVLDANELEPIVGETSISDDEHTIPPGTPCAGCGNSRRNLCEHCSRCWNCRASICPRK